MVLHKSKFFLALFLLIIAPLVAFKAIWLIHSQKAQGFMAFAGQGNAGDQIARPYSVIYFKHGKDTIWFNGLGNLHIPPGTPFPVRYQVEDPSDAKVDILVGIWGDTLVYGGIPLAMLLVLFLHPEVVPRHSKVRLTLQRPFIKLVPKK